jgi:hypothetical protein
MKTLLSLVFLVLCVYASAIFSQNRTTNIAGVTLDNMVKVGGQELTLNGAGVRTKSLFKVYVVGLYLAVPKTTTAEVISLAGSKRLMIVMLRDVRTEDLLQSFMAALRSNATDEERRAIASYYNQISEVFEGEPALEKGDIVTLDWVPGTGLRCYLNDEPVGQAIGDHFLYQAVLKVWLGDRAVESAVKTELLRGSGANAKTPDGVRRGGMKATDQ